MSAIAGICYWDERPLNDGEISRLEASSRDGGSPGHASQTAMPRPWLALQAFVLDFDRLSAIERQPHTFGGGSVLTWDGRLDNRDDLLLVLHNDLRDDCTDAALVSAAYQRWGLDCLRRLIGDWSLAIWDAEARNVILARDYMGTRPLYYRETPHSFAWATRLEAIASCFDLYSQPDDDYIAGRLAHGVPEGITPFQSVRSLLAGHVLVASQAKGVTIRRYWTFTPATIRYRDPRDHAERLRELLIDAVRVRLRSNRTIWCHLSGGWDSSTATCLAHRLIAHGHVDAPRVQPVSMVYRGPWADCGEDPFIQAVERWCRLTTVELPFIGFTPIAQLLKRRVPADHGTDIFNRLESPMSAAGDPVILTGIHGDDVMLQHRTHTTLIEALHSGHVLRFLRLCVGRARDKQLPLATLLMRLIRDTYLPGLGGDRHSRVVGPPRLQRRVIRHEGALRQRAKRSADDGRLGIPSLRDFSMAKRPLVGFLYRAGQSATVHFSGLASVLRTHPYTHRPLVEYVIGAPGLVLQEPGTPPRAGMRRALVDILPPEILNRHTKAMAGSSIARSERDHMEQLEQLGSPINWQLVQRGYLERDAVAAAITDFRAEGALLQSFPSKWLYLETWLQAITKRDEAISHPQAGLSLAVSSAGDQSSGIATV